MVRAVEREDKEAGKRAALTAKEMNTEKLSTLHWHSGTVWETEACGPHWRKWVTRGWTLRITAQSCF